MREIQLESTPAAQVNKTLMEEGSLETLQCLLEELRRCWTSHTVGKRPLAEHAGQCSASNLLAPDIFTTGTITGPGTSLFVSGSIDGYHCNITVDTGSDISVVHPDILSQEKRESLQPASSYLQTVTGERAPIRGRCELLVKIGSMRYCSRYGLQISMISAFWASTSWLLEDVWLTSRTTVCGLVVRRYHCRDQTLS